MQVKRYIAKKMNL